MYVTALLALVLVVPLAHGAHFPHNCRAITPMGTSLYRRAIGRCFVVVDGRPSGEAVAERCSTGIGGMVDGRLAIVASAKLRELLDFSTLRSHYFANFLRVGMFRNASNVWTWSDTRRNHGRSLSTEWLHEIAREFQIGQDADVSYPAHRIPWDYGQPNNGAEVLGGMNLIAGSHNRLHDLQDGWFVSCSQQVRKGP